MAEMGHDFVDWFRERRARSPLIRSVSVVEALGIRDKKLLRYGLRGGIGVFAAAVSDELEDERISRIDLGSKDCSFLKVSWTMERRTMSATRKATGKNTWAGLTSLTTGIADRWYRCFPQTNLFSFYIVLSVISAQYSVKIDCIHRPPSSVSHVSGLLAKAAEEQSDMFLPIMFGCYDLRKKFLLKQNLKGLCRRSDFRQQVFWNNSSAVKWFMGKSSQIRRTSRTSSTAWTAMKIFKATDEGICAFDGEGILA
ncbi:uncharacterized protein EV420DRAFT_1485016 [Desarmillaria tabescens]|uniref:Uncharacterized protein n=1 Tax=Armillaria tabescens TaxID=1929756 RepID=A0AA39JJJ2_ARMTA|nr:uncharacterized protein EV420DRAFT_1485016 [Desarmillaria tabescens]KAK0443367.1 hypothetical protein EV420DRAFT_1485016 [Desarmillaria tabescens]